MRRNERRNVAIPASQQDRRSPIIRLRQAESPIFLGDFDSECADLGQAFEIFRRNLAGSVDFVRIDMLAQIGFNLFQKLGAGRAIFFGLRRIRVDPVEIVATDKKVARKTAAVVQRIARSFGQFERFALSFRHFGSVDH